MKRNKIVVAAAIGVIVVCGAVSCNGKEVLNKIVSAVADEHIPLELVGNWCDTQSSNLGLSFFMNNGSVSAKTLYLTSEGDYTLTSIEGVFGIERNVISKGTFKVYSKLQTIEMIDEFNDVFYRNKYVLSETEDGRVLKLKNEDNTTSIYYADKLKQ